MWPPPIEKIFLLHPTPNWEFLLPKCASPQHTKKENPNNFPWDLLPLFLHLPWKWNFCCWSECGPKPEDPQLRLNFRYVVVVVVLWQYMFGLTKYSVKCMDIVHILFNILQKVWNFNSHANLNCINCNDVVQVLFSQNQ